MTPPQPPTQSAVGHRGCPGGCDHPVAPYHFACKSCWYRPPVDLRRRVSDTYLRDHADAMLDAYQWYKEHRPAAG